MVEAQKSFGRRVVENKPLTALVAGSLLTVGTVALDTSQAPSAKADVSHTFSVFSKKPLNDSGFYLNPGDRALIQQVPEPEGGKWTVDYRKDRKPFPLPYVDANGYSKATNDTIYQGCQVDPDKENVMYGTMLAYVGNGEIAVGANREIIATDQAFGELSLGINDQPRCMGDNRGSITEVVILFGRNGVEKQRSVQKIVFPKVSALASAATPNASDYAPAA
jgi:hypothetical protein